MVFSPKILALFFKNCILRVQTNFLSEKQYLKKPFYKLCPFWNLITKQFRIFDGEISTRLSKLTSMCTEAHFEGKNLSNKTIFPLNFLGCEPQIVRNYRNFPTSLSKPHSICAIDHCEENRNSLENTVFYHFRNKGRKIFDFRQSLLCTVGKTAFCVCRGHFWYVFWTLFISWTFLISEQEIFGSSTQKSWLCFFQNSILRVKTIFLSKKL